MFKSWEFYCSCYQYEDVIIFIIFYVSLMVTTREKPILII